MSKQRILYQLVSADGLKSEIQEMSDFKPEIKRALDIGLGGKYCEMLDMGVAGYVSRAYKYEAPEQVLFITFKEIK